MKMYQIPGQNRGTTQSSISREKIGLCHNCFMFLVLTWITRLGILGQRKNWGTLWKIRTWQFQHVLITKIHIFMKKQWLVTKLEEI